MNKNLVNFNIFIIILLKKDRMNKKTLEPVLTYPEDYFTNYSKYNNLTYGFQTNYLDISKQNEILIILKNLNKSHYSFKEEEFDYFSNYLLFQRKIIENMTLNIQQTNEFFLKNKK